MAYKRKDLVDNETAIDKELLDHFQDGIVSLDTTRYSHFSIDDFHLAFQDLTDNADTYTSIFDNALFAWLKEFHEATGATVSCYCFYQNASTDPTFTLDDVPTKYAAEFQENKDWLRFGFHALYQGINYASATAETAKTAYETTITALVNITGSTECIDRMPRLHNFAGSLEACQGMRDALCGPKGFLAAISTTDTDGNTVARQSYYLDETYNSYIFIHDYLYDATNQLHFVRTQDGGNVYKVSSLVSDINYALLGTYVEFFTHENQLTDGIKSAFKSAYNKLKTTHRPVFWMDLFR